VSFEGVEAPRPERAVGLQPPVDLGEGFWAQRIQTLLAIRAHHDEPGLAQHLEVLGHAGLAEPKALHQLSGGPLASTQQVENLSAVRLGQGGVGAYALILPDGDMNIAEELRRRRTALGWTLEQVAQQAQVSVGMLSLIETGKRRPSLRSWERLQGALGISEPLPEEAWR
jgi:helix-turn-helix protein